MAGLVAILYGAALILVFSLGFTVLLKVIGDWNKKRAARTKA